MITFNNIVSKFQAFCDDHKFIRTFSYGSPADVDLNKFDQYPLLHLVYTGGDYNSERAKTYNLECYILSVPPSEADKTTYQKESISDAEQVAEDILADIQNGGNIFSFGYHYDVTGASVTPLEEEKSNALAGCLLDLSISVPYSYDSCNAPLEGVEPEGSTPSAFKARGLLRVKEIDGSPDVLSVATMNVPNGSLTDDGDGVVTLDFNPSGQVSTFTTNSTTSADYTTTGSNTLSFGSILGGTTTFTQSLAAGFSAGWDSGVQTVLGAPVSITSTVQISVTVDVTAPTGSLLSLNMQNTTGFFTAPTYTSATIVGDGTTQTATITSTAGSVTFWQLSNTAQVQALIAANPSTITIEPKSLTITVTHA